VLDSDHSNSNAYSKQVKLRDRQIKQLSY